MINATVPLGVSVECSSCGVEHNLPILVSIKKGSSLGLSFALCPECVCTLNASLKESLKEAIGRGART